MNARRARTALLALAALAAAGRPASRAVAAEPPPAPAPARAGVVLPLKDGGTVSGAVESASATEVVLRAADGSLRRIPLADLAPEGAFRALAATAAPDDGPARLALAELASEMGLFAHAREEYERALALGALDAAGHAKAVAEAEEAAVSAGVARAERAVDAGDVAAALEVLRTLKADFGSSASAAKADALLRRVEEGIAARDADQASARADLERMALEGDRARERLRRRTEARAKIAAGGEAAAEARGHMEKGVVTRVRKKAEEAQAAFEDARRGLGRLRRIVPKEGPARTDALALLSELDRVQFALLLDAAKFFWREKVFRDAESFAARASYIDPVHPDLLDLRREIREHRIRYRASSITNARPRSSG